MFHLTRWFSVQVGLRAIRNGLDALRYPWGWREGGCLKRLSLKPALGLTQLMVQLDRRFCEGSLNRFCRDWQVEGCLKRLSLKPALGVIQLMVQLDRRFCEGSLNRFCRDWPVEGCLKRISLKPALGVA